MFLPFSILALSENQVEMVRTERKQKKTRKTFDKTTASLTLQELSTTLTAGTSLSFLVGVLTAIKEAIFGAFLK